MVTGCSTYFPFGYLFPLHNYFLNAAVQNSIAGLQERYINPVLNELIKKMTDWVLVPKGMMS